MPDRLANAIKQRWTDLGLTQAELADRVGVTRKTVNTIENQVFVPSTVLALKLAKALDVVLSALRLRARPVDSGPDGVEPGRLDRGQVAAPPLRVQA